VVGVDDDEMRAGLQTPGVLSCDDDPDVPVAQAKRDDNSDHKTERAGN